MKRKITDALLKWKNSPVRKPLLLQGPRQVGKTYTLIEFGRKYYDTVAYFNFQTDPGLSATFEESLEPSYLLPLLQRMAKVSILKERTLIIFDEVQLCERALTSLKYFCEEAPEYHVIAAGSLLGVAVNRQQYSFPVGKVNILNMYPMNFFEFLEAMGEEDLEKQIQQAYRQNSALPTVIHQDAMRLYRQYLVIGGMPECVQNYISTEDYLLVRQTQGEILTGYLDDMSKYNKGTEIQKTRLTYNSITAQLSKKNTRFQYKLIKSGGRAKEFENALEWLELSGIIYRVYCVDQAKKPLENYKNIDDFKVYVSDPGLLGAKQGVLADDILYESDELDDFKGGMTENYVCCQLKSNGYRPYYWREKTNAEVDFVVLLDRDVIPLEVKAADRVRSKSLDYYMKQYDPAYAIRISGKNFAFEDGKKIVPLYAVCCI